MSGEYYDQSLETRQTLAMIIADLEKTPGSEAHPVGEVDLERYLDEMGQDPDLDHELVFAIRNQREGEEREFIVVLNDFEQRKRKIIAAAKIYDASDLSDVESGIVRFQLHKKKDDEPYRARIKLLRGIDNIADYKERVTGRNKTLRNSILGGSAMVVAGVAIFKVSHKNQ